ncbi:unnamed protein product [Ilex paraguariensis]|uniref:Uncharacterized protein n=1 Tax=Ilex paraguariensis TaxID=185542 RepID=A0ABC8SLA6_9AQUA
MANPSSLPLQERKPRKNTIPRVAELIILFLLFSLLVYRLKPAHELPSVDMFVRTTDPVLEPPIITVNTVLSLLAVDYPANKLACYVSDDGCSSLTFYALVEAAKFAKLWVPFCKKFNITVRAPFRYFNGESLWSEDSSLDFRDEWKKIKGELRTLTLISHC